MIDLNAPFREIVQALDLDGPYVDISPIVDSLTATGWDDERLVKNDLLEAAGRFGRPNTYQRFIDTMARLATELHAAGIPFIFIKCVREYRYSDTNVDVLVPGDRLREVASLLRGSVWTSPHAWDRLEQFAIERAKMKLPSTKETVLAAHLYGGLSWRYQSDIGLLRHDGRTPNPEQLQIVSLREYGARGVLDGEVWIPSDEIEFVLQAAHVAFENFRITVGEAVHFQLLKLRAPQAWRNAHRLAADYGCQEALRMMDRESARIAENLHRIQPADYPRTLPAPELLKAFRDRAATLFGSGRWLSAVNELGTSMAVFGLVRAIRAVRRLRRGREDYR